MLVVAERTVMRDPKFFFNLLHFPYARWRETRVVELSHDFPSQARASMHVVS